jgi:putative inorganic carbon (HCO3(-)) transporter
MILALILICFAVIAYKKPVFAVGLILAAVPAYLLRYNILGIPTTFLELILLIFLSITLLKNYHNLSELKKFQKVNWFVILFLIAGVISVYISPERVKALGLFKAFILEPVLFFYALKFVIKKPLDLVVPLNLLFLASILVSCFGIIQNYTLLYLPLKFWGTGEEVLRITSIFPHPNALALYLAPIASFFTSLFISNEKILNKKNLIFGLTIIFIALFLTYSRGAWLGVTGSLIIILALKYPIKKVAAIGLILVSLILIIPATRNRLSLIATDASSNAHKELMLAAVEKLQQNPILGNGLFGFRTTLLEQNYQGEILNYPHNIFLNFWVELGILGLISFLAIVVLAVRQFEIKQDWFKLAGLAFILTVFIHGMVDISYFKNDLSVLFWFILALFYI